MLLDRLDLNGLKHYDFVQILYNIHILLILPVYLYNNVNVSLIFIDCNTELS